MRPVARVFPGGPASGDAARRHQARLAYRGEVWLHWVAEEACGAALCQRYRMGGPGLDGREGFVSVDSQRQHIVQLDLPLPNNREWRDFALRLESVRELVPEGWQDYKRAAIAQYFARR